MAWLLNGVAFAQTLQSPPAQRVQWNFQPKAFWAGLPGVSQDTRTDLTRYETQVYGHAYENDIVPKRLDRLEQSLGIASPVNPGPSGERMARLSQYFSQWSQHPVNNMDHQLSMLSYMEQHLLKITYAQWPVSQRLTQLETAVFARSFETEPSSKRIQRLYQQLPIPNRLMRIQSTPSVAAPSNTVQNP